ncbi:unnamed protein product, partial [Gulo gulo]
SLSFSPDGHIFLSRPCHGGHWGLLFSSVLCCFPCSLNPTSSISSFLLLLD